MNFPIIVLISVECLFQYTDSNIDKMFQNSVSKHLVPKIIDIYETYINKVYINDLYIHKIASDAELSYHLPYTMNEFNINIWVSIIHCCPYCPGVKILSLDIFKN